MIQTHKHTVSGPPSIIGAPHICVLIYVHLCTDVLHYVHTTGPPSIILFRPPSKL